MLRVHPADELTADRLWALGAIAVTERDGVLDAGFPDAISESAAVAALADTDVGVERLEDDPSTWADMWRDGARPVRAGRFVLQPAWVPAEPGGAAVVSIEPGRAFGVGSHPTTRLAVEALEDIVVEGDHVLDIGTGTGVLAIVAARLGAERVTAIDTDPHAVEVALSNARRNAVQGTVDASATDLADVAGTYDVVVLNLGGLLGPCALAPLITSRASRGVVVSGLLDPRSGAGPDPAPLDDALLSGGFALAGVGARNGWMARTYVSPEGTPARRGRGSPAPNG